MTMSGTADAVDPQRAALYLRVLGGDLGAAQLWFDRAVLERYRNLPGWRVMRTDTVGRVRETLNPSLTLEGLLLTMFDGRNSLARQVQQWEPEGLLAGLRRLGIRPQEVDVVLTSHLHWDHAGGFTRRGEGGSVELTFPRARHFVQRSELEFALHPDPRSAAGGYVAEDFVPVADAGLLETVETQKKLLKFIPIPEDFITNNAFGGTDMKTLYVTAGKTLYKVRTEVAGLPR